MTQLMLTDLPLKGRMSYFSLGVCILLRVLDQVMGVFISVYATSLW
jgi:hypothetical protein